MIKTIAACLAFALMASSVAPMAAQAQQQPAKPATPAPTASPASPTTTNADCHGRNRPSSGTRISPLA